MPQPATLSYRLPVTITLTLIYNIFFWEEKLGINLPLFSTMLMGVILYLNKEARSSRSVQVMAVGAVLTGVLVVLYNSGTAKFAHIASVFLFIGFSQLPQLKFVGNAILSTILSYITILGGVLEAWDSLSKNNQYFGRLSSYLKLTVIPLLVLVIFSFLFYFANAPFAALLDQLGEYLSTSFMEISPLRILFFISGFYLAAGLFFHTDLSDILKTEQAQSDQLLRKKPAQKRFFSFLDLKKEYKTGILLISLINILLLVNNVLDIQHVWFSFEAQSPKVLKQFVHEGTYLLIFSILLSMGIMLKFFRGNLNFYPNNKALRYLSYAWIVQNGFLLLSVGMRNYHFISQYALAYKRIGVFFFLLLTLFGLFTLGLKIRDRMSGFYLFKANAWALYGAMILLSMVNWDMVITRYNIDHYLAGKELDRAFLLDLSDQTLPLVLAHPEMFNTADIQNRYQPTTLLVDRVRAFKEEQESYSWLSWNLADARTYTQLK